MANETATYAGRTVLVTGAGGFIGSHLAEELVRRGARVRAFVHYRSEGNRGWLEHSELAGAMEFHAGDVTDRDSLHEAIEGCDCVFHLAALIAIPYSYRAPLLYLRTNVEGTVNLLSAARERGVARIVHTSTSETYGTARYVPIDENHPLQAQSPYAASKIGADKMAQAFHASFATPVVTLRPFNTYGPRQSGRAVIPTIVAQCLAGKEISLGNLTPTRDFNYVADTVDAFCRAGLAPGVEGLTLNVGSGEEISIAALARLIGELTGRTADVRTAPERLRPPASEVERLCAANDLARDKLGWRSATGLRDGLTRTIEWIAANPAGLRGGDFVL